MKIGVIGAGSWGTALANLLSQNGHDVLLWSHKKTQVESIQISRENKQYLPNIKLNDKLKLTYIDEDLKNVDIAVISVPSKALREVCERFYPFFNNGKIIVNVSKGIEENSLKRFSQVIQEILPFDKVAVLSGPSHAEEVAKGLATICVASSYDINVAKTVQDAFMNNTFRVYTNTDVVGVEIGGALKNLIALAAGASDGCGFGDNAKAALMTRGLAEISRLGIAMGAKSETFSGITGLGDLIVTCTSSHSRNRKAGILLGQGKSIQETLKEVKMVVEGINIAKAAYNLSLKYNVNMPITKEIYEVLFNGKNVKQAVIDLMTRDKAEES